MMTARSKPPRRPARSATKPSGNPAQDAPRHGLARVLSKRGICSRTQAAVWITEGRVAVNGCIRRDPEFPIDARSDRINVDGVEVAAADPVYIMVNKSRGVVTTASDEQGRVTVYSLLADAGLPWLGPVGRLDKASEGLLLMTNDTQWANRLASPEGGVDKTYHVQIDRLPDDALLAALHAGIDEAGHRLAAKSVIELRRGGRNAWLEIALDEGRNRHIRRLLAAFDIAVLRLIRVAIGQLALGDLPKGRWRHLRIGEVAELGDAGGMKNV